jgi:hypothetical protein
MDAVYTANRVRYGCMIAYLKLRFAHGGVGDDEWALIVALCMNMACQLLAVTELLLKRGGIAERYSFIAVVRLIEGFRSEIGLRSVHEGRWASTRLHCCISVIILAPLLIIRRAYFGLAT